MKNRFIYKITCLCGDYKGKYYIGQHTTDDINDGYAGSGIKINEYYSKYGKRLNETYKFKILRNGATSQQQLDKWEKKYIDKYLGKEKCLNMIEGGLHNELNIKLVYHTIELKDDGTYRNVGTLLSIEDPKENEEQCIYSYNDDVPLYRSDNGKLYSKAQDLIKAGILFY